MSNLSESPVLLPQIAGYQITRRLGRGGMADVYLGSQLSLARPVAIKVLAAERTAGEETVARFEHEARTIARLDHPHIVSIFDVGRTSDGRLYYTMPYLPRGDLSRRELRGDEKTILSIMRALCRALAYAHKFGVVHRDVKPENVLFDHLDRPLLADFGIALTTRDFARVTREGSTIGSSGYMSPEQARGATLDGRADLYSLGVVAYELLSGDLPFHGPDTLAMALAHVEQPVPRLPPALKRWQGFIDKAMAKHPEDRFQSAFQMEAALGPIEASLAGTPEAPAKSLGVRPWFGLIAACVLLALAAVMLISAIRYMHEGTPSATSVAASVIDAVPGSTDSGNANATTLAAPVPADVAPNSAAAAPLAGANETQAEAGAQPKAPAQPLATRAELSPGTVLHDPNGPELVFVPAAREPGAHGFALARYEVSRGDYAAFARATGRAASRCLEPMQPLSRLRKLSWRDPGFAQNDQHPVVCVSWNDAIAYAQWLSERTHAAYRLPTRAEWLHAARAVGATGTCAQAHLSGRGVLPFHFGSAGCKDGFTYTAPIGHLKPNALGAYDLAGNVSEWSADCKPSGIDAKGHCVERLFSGTSWRDDANSNNLDALGNAETDIGYTNVGIRLLRKLGGDSMPLVER